MPLAQLLALLLSVQTGYASDAVLLERTMRAVHPGLHRHQTPQQVDAHFATLHRDLSREGITRPEAYLAVSRLTAALRCGHTYPNPSNQSAEVRAELFDRADKLPFTFRIEDRRMFVLADSSETLAAGTEVVAIDGVPVGTIFERLLPFIRGDGGNDGKRLYDLQLLGSTSVEAFDVYHPLVFPARGARAEVATRGKTVTLPRVTRQQRGGSKVAADDQWQFTRDGETATLRLGTFSTWSMKRDWRAFLRESFAAARGARKLVIDVRGNEGGDNDVVDELLRHIAAKPVAVTGWRELVRYRKIPADVGAHVSSWDDSFRDFGELPAYGDGFFLRKEAASRTIEPAPDAFAGEVELWIDEANSSATFLLAHIAKEHRLATLVGRETGGNRRGTNGGRIAFLKLPASGIEVDVPLVGYFPTTPQPDRGVVPDRGPKDSPVLAALVEAHWQRELERNPYTRSELGLPVERLPEVSYAAAEREAAFARELLAKLERVDANTLTDDERITLGILETLQRRKIDGLQHFWLQSVVTPYASPVSQVNLVLARLPFATDEDKARYVRLLEDHARFIDELAEVVRGQQRRGFLLPKAELPIVRALLTTAPLQRADERVRETIAKRNEPAMARLAAVFSAEYEAAAPERPGLGQYPGGMDAYRYLVRVHTGTELTPDEIHQLGLREVERIDREMAAVRERLGFQGTKAELHQRLRSDPRFFAATPEEIGTRLMAQVRRIEPHLARLFATSPHAPYGVARLVAVLEPSMTFGYYQQPAAGDGTGRYLYNGSKLNERNLLFAPALMAHELVPGHHFQIARQLENEAIPLFRRKRYDTAFAEGWGEYAAFLGEEMKLYEDPYDRYGRLMMDMLLSARLVTDTGMNALGWPRERAMQFLREHTLLSETEIATETLRYAADIPAQALAYKIGSLRMIELRRRAERELGPRFDVRAFHEWLIGSGSMPLPILEDHVARKIAAAR